MRVKEWHGDVVFLHEVVPGAADRSYGIQVAKLAGLPARGGRARKRSCWPSSRPRTASSPARRLIDDLPLFAAARSTATAAEARPDPAVAALIAALAALDPDDMSPRDALEALYRLKLQAGGKA